MQQNNARLLLMQMQMMLPQIDQYLPDRASVVRQKLSELGMNNNQMASMSQMASAMQQNTSDSLLTAAGVAPPQMQPRLYQQQRKGRSTKATRIARLKSRAITWTNRRAIRSCRRWISSVRRLTDAGKAC